MLLAMFQHRWFVIIVNDLLAFSFLMRPRNVVGWYMHVVGYRVITLHDHAVIQ